MKGYGGGRGPPASPGVPAPPPPPFICIDRFTSSFICIPFILCFQCVFDLYLLLLFIPSGRCEKECTSGKNIEKSMPEPLRNRTST